MKIKINSSVEDFPRDYSLTMLSAQPPAASASSSSSSSTTAATASMSRTPFYAFHERGEHATLDGPVTTFFAAKPDNTPEYRAMNKARLIRATAPKRCVVV